MRINIAQISYPVRVLGPGKRIGIWVQGCLKRCPKCIAGPFLREEGGVSYPVEVLKDEILFYLQSTDAAGITISGGEPLLQWPALRSILQSLRAKAKPFSCVLYTGYKRLSSGNFEGLNGGKAEGIEDLVDLIIDDEYVDQLNDGAFMRGSSNQGLHFLNSSFQTEFEKYAVAQGSKRGFQIFQKNNFVAGMPPRGFIKELAGLVGN